MLSPQLLIFSILSVAGKYSCHWLIIFKYKSSFELYLINSPNLWTLSPILGNLRLEGRTIEKKLNDFVKALAGIDLQDKEIKFLNFKGNVSNVLIIVFDHRYLLYPPNSSSPPSPDKHTLTWLLVSFDINIVGIWEESANGSSYTSGIFGIKSIASLGEI